MQEYLIINPSGPLCGTVDIVGAKNSALVVMASLILTNGISKLSNMPLSADVYCMSELLTLLGARVSIDQKDNKIVVDTSNIDKFTVSPEIMKSMRASILVLGPLLAKLGKAVLAFPGGDAIGSRPIDFHLKAFSRMGAVIQEYDNVIQAEVNGKLRAQNFVLDYPSVGATENIMLASVLTLGTSKIVNAALEPEVLDLIDVLKKMGACIEVKTPATIIIEGVKELKPIEHAIIPDRLEAGSFLLAAAMTKGEINIPQAPACFMELFLSKLGEIGHNVEVDKSGFGVKFKATDNPKPISFKTMPYPGFPTDLQAPTMAALCLADGVSTISETVWDNRFLQVSELRKFGANILVKNNKAYIHGNNRAKLTGATVQATDIRSAFALLITGLIASGSTKLLGVEHLYRGYQDLVKKLRLLGSNIQIIK